MKSKLFAGALVLCLLLSCFSFASCGSKQLYSAYSFDYFDTVITVKGYAASKEEFDRVSKEMIDELGEFHRLFTIYHRFEGMENLCTVNEISDGRHRTVTVDRRIIDLLLYAKEMYALTDGRVNVAMGSVLKIWHEYRTVGAADPASAKLPPMEKLEQAAAHTDINCLLIDEVNSTVTLTDPEMSLDVGAIAKGYAVEMVARAMEKKGITGYLLNVGGNVRALGEKPNGEGWSAAVESPTESEESTAILSLTREALVTSGSYQRYYIVDGSRYHHIIHPDTLMPAEGFLSVSVLTPHSGQGDALSTALFCMSLEEGMALVASLPDTEAQWVLEDGSVFTSDGWSLYAVEPE